MSDIHPTSARLSPERRRQVILLAGLYTMEDQQQVSHSDVLVRGLDDRWLRDGPRAEALAQQAQAPTGQRGASDATEGDV